jgi:hypothetical protein
LIKYEQSSAKGPAEVREGSRFSKFDDRGAALLIPGRDAEKTKANKMYNNWTCPVKIKMAFGMFQQP